MKVIVNGKTVKINNEQIVIAKALSQKYLNTIKDKCMSKGQLMLYLSNIVMLNVMTNDILNSFDRETLSEIEKLADLQNKKPT